MATAKNFHETCAARGHAHADRRRGGAPQARIYIATLLLFLTTLGLLYVVLFVSGDSQPSLWAVMLLRILAFLLPVYLIVQARAAGRAPTGPGTLWPPCCPCASSCRRAPRAGPSQAPAPSGLPAARAPRRAGARARRAARAGPLQGPTALAPGRASAAALRVPPRAGVPSACARSARRFGAACCEAGVCDRASSSSGVQVCRCAACSHAASQAWSERCAGMRRLCWRTCASGTPSMRGACRPRDATLCNVPFYVPSAFGSGRPAWRSLAVLCLLLALVGCFSWALCAGTNQQRGPLLLLRP